MNISSWITGQLIKLFLGFAFFFGVAFVYVTNVVDITEVESSLIGLEATYIDTVTMFEKRRQESKDAKEILEIEQDKEFFLYKLIERYQFDSYKIFSEKFMGSKYKRKELTNCSPSKSHSFLCDSTSEDKKYAIYPLEWNGRTYGYLGLGKKITAFSSSTETLASMGIILILIFSSLFIFSYFILRKIKNEFNLFRTRISSGLIKAKADYRFTEFEEMEKIANSNLSQEKQLQDLRLKLADGELRRVAHDLQSPIYAIKIALDVYSIQLPHQVKRILKGAVGKLEQASTYGLAIDNLQANKPSFPLLPALTEVVEHYESLTKSLGLEIEFDFKIDTNIFNDVRVNSNRYLFNRAITNLLKNSLEALGNTRNQKKIEVKVTKNRNFVLISIFDTGEGIPKSSLSKIKKGGHTTKKSGNGVGLKESIVFFEKLGGGTEIESQLGVFTLVKVSLPYMERGRFLEGNTVENAAVDLM